MNKNLKKSSVIIASLLLISTLFVGCSNNTTKNPTEDYPVTIEGQSITKKPEKIIVLSDSIADIILDLNYENKIVGKTSNCTQEGLKTIFDIGMLESLNLTKIKELSPDIILCDKEISNETQNEIVNSNIKIIKLKRANTKDELKSLYQNIGCIINGAVSGYNKGTKCVTDILSDLDEISKIIPTKTVPSTICYLYDDQGTILSRDNFFNEIVKTIKVIDIFSDQKENKIDVNNMKVLNPNYIFCDVSVKEKLMSNENFKELEAVKENKIFEFDSKVLNRQGESILETTKFLASTIYPELKSTTNDKSKKNQSENDVKSKSILDIQKRLDDLNYMHVAPSGQIEDTTVQAVKDFQFLNNMETTGEINDDFTSKLFSSDAKPRPDSARDKN